MDFSYLKCQLKWKKIDTACFVKIFQVLADEGMGKYSVKLLSVQLKKFFKFMPAWLACEKQNILMPQPCLHTLMQTCLSANQSVSTIIVILWSKS